MLNREEFLGKFQEFTRQSGIGRLSEEQVREYFKETDLSEEQFQMILNYVEEKKEAGKLTSEDENYIAEYMETLRFLPKEKEGEKEALFAAVCQGKRPAVERLTELYLAQVVEEAKALHQPGFLIEDLIQEGNVGLTIGIQNLQSTQAAHESILQAIQQQIKTAIELELEEAERDKKMIAQVKKLDESLTRLEAEYGRKVSVDELAVDMEITQDEVLDILKLAGEDIGDEEQYFDAHDHEHHHHEHDHHIENKR